MAGTFIEQIFNLQDDQMEAMYALSFPQGLPANVAIPATMTTDELVLRMDKEFEIPERKWSTYEYYYNGLKVTKSAPKDETDKMFTLDFRCDQKAAVIDILDSWLRLVYNDTEGIYGPENATRSELKLSLLAGDPSNLQRTTQKEFLFRYIKPISMKVSPFNHEGNNASRVSAQFIYLFYEKRTPAG